MVNAAMNSMFVANGAQYEWGCSWDFDTYRIHIQYTCKIRKEAKIRQRYYQVPHLTQDIIWENNKNTINITNNIHEVRPSPAGDHKAAKNRLKSMRNTKHTKKHQ